MRSDVETGGEKIQAKKNAKKEINMEQKKNI